MTEGERVKILPCPACAGTGEVTQEEYDEITSACTCPCANSSGHEE